MPRYREQIIEFLAPLFEKTKHQDWQGNEPNANYWELEIVENGKVTFQFPASQRNEDGSYSLLLPHTATGFLDTEIDLPEAVGVYAHYHKAAGELIATHNAIFDAADADWAKRFVSEAQAEAVAAMKKQA